MTRWDVVWGGGVLAVLAVLSTQVVRSVREVLAVERRRRNVVGFAGRGQSAGARPDAAVAAVDAPSPGVVRGADGFLPAVGPSPHDAAARVVAELEGRR